MNSTTDTTQHPDVSEISDLTEGLLPPSRTAHLRQHLDECSLCADVRSSLEEIRGMLGTLPGPPRMPGDIAGRIDAALAAEALLSATAPVDGTHVSRETRPADLAAEPAPALTRPVKPVDGPVDRPAGRAAAAGGPGRGKPNRRRRRVALGAVVGIAAVSVGVLLMQVVRPAGGESDAMKADTAMSSAENETFSGVPLESRVATLLSADEGAPSPRNRSQGGATEPENGPRELLGTLDVPVPACVSEGIGRTEPALAAEKGTYQGLPAYLVVLPDRTDAAQVRAYVVDAACTTSRNAAKADVLLQHAYPRP
ncbi:hypothetical protein [Streptomyces sp. NPDC047928]|uniref:hypothetical protein n=1 Tax=unclassified Streptomyces TaxID=2593676 RepID=UPI003711D592